MQHFKKPPHSGIVVFTEVDITESLEITAPARAYDGGFLVVKTGAITLTCNLNIVTCTSNGLYFIMAGMVYTVEKISDDFSCIGISVEASFFLKTGAHQTGSELFQFAKTGSLQQYIIQEKEVAILADMLAMLKSFFLSNTALYYQQEILSSQVMTLMYTAASFFRKHNDVETSKLNRKEELTAQFLGLLTANCKRERSVQFYADKLAVTKDHLSRVVKQLLGNNPAGLLDAAVIVEAKLLLNNPALSIAQVAAELQFSDQSVFGKYFKNLTGITPSEYRSRNKDKQ